MSSTAVVQDRETRTVILGDGRQWTVCFGDCTTPECIEGREILALDGAPVLDTELDRLREQVAHLSRGLDTMMGWHESMMTHIRTVADDYREQENWCSVYDEAMRAIGIAPINVQERVSITVTFSMDVEADRAQRRGNVSFMNSSIRYGAYRAIADALDGVTIFDSDYEELGNIDVDSISVDGSDYDQY